MRRKTYNFNLTVERKENGHYSVHSGISVDGEPAFNLAILELAEQRILKLKKQFLEEVNSERKNC